MRGSLRVGMFSAAFSTQGFIPPCSNVLLFIVVYAKTRKKSLDPSSKYRKKQTLSTGLFTLTSSLYRVFLWLIKWRHVLSLIASLLSSREAIMLVCYS